jgi:hypothetical protein
VKGEAEAPDGPFKHSARSFVRVFFYQRSGTDVIDQALYRVYALLHRQKALTGKWEVRWANDITDQVDEALGCSMHLGRYQIWRTR